LLFNFALDMPLGRSRKIRWDWKWMGHINFWLMLLMWIYWKIA
jgi:hypothetical protein